MTNTERVVKNLIEGINRAFGDLEVAGYWERDKADQHMKTKVLVRALERHAPAGQGMTMTGQHGFSLTIGDRVAQFSGEGRLIEQGKAPVERSQEDWKRVRDKRPMEFARYCRNEITEAELFAEEPSREQILDAIKQSGSKK